MKGYWGCTCSLPQNVYSGCESRFLIHLHVTINYCPQLLLSLIQFLVHSYWLQYKLRQALACKAAQRSYQPSSHVWRTNAVINTGLLCVTGSPEGPLVWQCTQSPLHSKCVRNSHLRLAVAGCRAPLHLWDCTVRHLALQIDACLCPSSVYSFSGVWPQGKVLPVIA